LIDTELVVRVVHGAARTLGSPTALPVLTDERLNDTETADEVVAAAGYHAILPLLWHAIENTPDVPAALRSTTHDEYLRLVARALRLRHLVEVVDEALTAAKIPYAIYKGPALARYYPGAEQRAFGDVDLLINRLDVDRADMALREAGLSGGWSGVESNYGETSYLHGGHGALDVHWHVMREPRIRAAFNIDSAEMLARTRRVRFGDHEMSVLDPVDELIATATHACFDGAYRLGWFVDVSRVLADGDLDWNEARARARRTHTNLPVQVIIDRTRRALEVDTPQPMARGLWRGALATLSAVRPVERTFRQAGRGGLAFRSTRASSTRSFVALGGLIFTEGVRPLIANPQHRWRLARKRRI
jgi:hypothetical protein